MECRSKVSLRSRGPVLPIATTMVRDPSIHAQHIQRVHGVKGGPLLDFIAEADVPIKLVPELTRPHEVQHLLMQIDQVGPQRGLVPS
jgi:hypothetical protein